MVTARVLPLVTGNHDEHMLSLIAANDGPFSTRIQKPVQVLVLPRLGRIKMMLFASAVATVYRKMTKISAAKGQLTLLVSIRTSLT